MLLGYHITRLERIISGLLPFTTIKCKNCEEYNEDINECDLFNQRLGPNQYCAYFDKNEIITKEDKTYCKRCKYFGKFIEMSCNPDYCDREVKYKCTCSNFDLTPIKTHDQYIDKFDIVTGSWKFKGCKGYKSSFWIRLVNWNKIRRN